MNFATIEFAIFFIFVFLVYWQLDKKKQNLFLLLVSLFFYACWDWHFLSLIIISIISNYLCGLWIHKTEQIHWRRIWLSCSIIINIGILSYFKYAGFFVDSAIALAAHFDWKISEVTLNITLPVGISFYIFQSLSYTLDIYRRQLTPEHKFLDFATFVAFFPQLVAGPIVRAKEFLYQLEIKREFSGQQLENGIYRFMTGFFKKTFIADNLAIYLVDPVFSDPASYSSGTLWLAMLGYAAQIYADFSGYSNMAIGCALMLGFKLPENFQYPYLATNFSDFWQRWHTTMSRFFRDYVYIPLGGNRCSRFKNMRNLSITTLISGLWHGASWTFVAWGGLHGLYIAINHAISDLKRKNPSPKSNNPNFFIHTLPQWITTQLLICFAWVLFRSTDFSSAHMYLMRLFDLHSGHGLSISLNATLCLCFIAIIIDHLYGWLKEKDLLPPNKIRNLAVPILLVTLLILVFKFKPEGNNPFIYFQF